MRHREVHRSQRAGWLRAAVLGANDGLVSTASLVLGVLAGEVPAEGVLMAGAAGLVAGSLSMAAGEYVSVSSQADSEEADLAKERAELEEDPEHELAELTAIYAGRGLSGELARQVAEELTAHDALAAHARDELGLTDERRAQPLSASLASAGAFALGAALPLVALVLSRDHAAVGVVMTALIGLGGLGALSAYLGGARPVRAALRVLVWGALAMALTAGVGVLLGKALP